MAEVRRKVRVVTRVSALAIEGSQQAETVVDSIDVQVGKTTFQQAIVDTVGRLVMRLQAFIAGRDIEEPGYDIYPPKLWEPHRTTRFELGEQMYAQAGAQAGAGGPQGGAAGDGGGQQGGKADEDVVDAEFEEVKDKK